MSSKLTGFVKETSVSTRYTVNTAITQHLNKLLIRYCFTQVQHLYNPWNEGKPVKIGRDGQEIQPRVGEELGRLFSEDKAVDLTPILRKSKEAARKHRVKVGGVKSGPLGGQHRVVRHGDRGRHHRGGRGRGGIESGRGRGDGGRGRRPRYEDQGKYSRYEDTRGSHGGGVGGR